MKRMLLFFYCCLFCAASVAQSYTVSLHSVDGKENLLSSLSGLPASFASSEAAYRYLRDLVPALQAEGFLAASIDSISIRDNHYAAFVFLGEGYKWAKVDMDSLPQEMLSQNGFSKIQWQGKKLEPALIARISEKTLQWSEQNGYPFAKVSLDVSEEKPNEIHAAFRWNKGTLQRLDTIRIEGEMKISRNYLLRYLDIKQGALYNEKKIRALSGRLRDLAFLQEARPLEMAFGQFENQLTLYLKEKKANHLSALIGLLPNSVETGKFMLTADAAFLFQNILGQGEYMDVSYQNLQYKSPRFKAHIVYPYLLNTPLGLDADFDLFKKDTTFRRTTFHGGLRYYLNATDYVRIFYQNQSNRLGVIDTGFIKANKQLPQDADVAAKGAGMELAVSKVDNRILPRKGFDAKMSTTVLQRQVRKSDEVLGLSDASGFDYTSLYDSFAQRANQVMVQAGINYYLPIAKKIVLKTAYTGAYLHGGNLFRNELYQIGGFRLLRGFDEQSIYTNHYHVAVLELRLLLDQRSYFYLFSDNGWVQSRYSGYAADDVYNGLGLGAALETKTGIFSISYAVGRHRGNPIQFRQSKIHFGYAAYF